MAPDRLHLNVFVMGHGHHEAAWRHPRSTTAAITDVTHYRRLAQRAEEGLLDSVFFADQLIVGGDTEHRPRSGLEPLTLLAALATATERIGLIATASTTYTEPYNLARQFASLDHISHGRIGWNIVTSWARGAARNFGLDRPIPHDERYARAFEYMEVVTRLWDSWTDDAILHDRESGRFADPGRIKGAGFEGRYYRVNGALTVPRPPQGIPSSCRPGRRRRAASSPRGTRRRSSPRSRIWPRRATSPPTSGAVRPPRAATPGTSRSCRGSAPSSARPRRRPGGLSGN
nr:hypothetical protein GCM10010200_006830 [Actinomadura rugatobispora]